MEKFTNMCSFSHVRWEAFQWDTGHRLLQFTSISNCISLNDGEENDDDDVEVIDDGVDRDGVVVN